MRTKAKQSEKVASIFCYQEVAKIGISPSGCSLCASITTSENSPKITGVERAIAKSLQLKDQPGFDFPLLSDAHHRVIDRYGLLNISYGI